MKNIHLNYSLILILLASFVLLFFASLPFIVRDRALQQQHLIPVISHQNPPDYLTYLAFIRESKDGSWLIPAMYTTEKTQPTLNYTFYIFLGKIAAVFSLSAIVMYQLARIIGVLFFSISLYMLTGFIVGKKYAWIAVCLGLSMVAPAQIFGVMPYGSGALSNFPMAWYYANPLTRIDMIPHHAFSAGFLVLTVYLYFCYEKKHHLHLLVFSAVFSFLSSLIHPASALLILFAFPVTAGYVWLAGGLQKHSWSLRTCFCSAVVVVSSGLALIIVKAETLKGFPWSIWTYADVTIFNAIAHYNRDFIIGGGILLVLSIPWVVSVVWKRVSYEKIFLAVWIFLPYLLIPFNSTIGVAKFRFAFINNFIPVGIAVFYSIQWIVSHIRSMRLRYVIIGAFAGVWMLCVAPSVYEQYLYIGTHAAVYSPYLAVSADMEEAMMNLQTHTVSSSGIILSDEVDGLFLPAYARVISYVGHEGFTYRYSEKIQAARAFFLGDMKPSDAQKFIAGNNIQYIFEGPREKLGFSISAYHLPMRILFSNTTVTIYTRL